MITWNWRFCGVKCIYVKDILNRNVLKDQISMYRNYGQNVNYKSFPICYNSKCVILIDNKKWLLRLICSCKCIRKQVWVVTYSDKSTQCHIDKNNNSVKDNSCTVNKKSFLLLHFHVVILSCFTEETEARRRVLRGRRVVTRQQQRK